jgi:hypothetical protein
MTRHAIVIAILSVAAAGGVAPAHADESSYLADLAARGIPVLIPSQAISDGFRVCGEIRGGESPQTAAGTFGIYYNAVGPQIVDIAQRNLCPDTLH